jgi:hypothetical protein
MGNKTEVVKRKEIFLRDFTQLDRHKLLSLKLISIFAILSFLLLAPITKAVFYDQAEALAYSNYQGSLISATATAVNQPGTLGQTYSIVGLLNNGYSYTWSLAMNADPHAPENEYYMQYQVFQPNGQQFGATGIAEFSGGSVNQNDQVRMIMSVDGSEISMTATDTDTGATATCGDTCLLNYGGIQFVGNSDPSQISYGEFTGLVTDLYYSTPVYTQISDTQVETYYLGGSNSTLQQPAWIDIYEIDSNGNLNYAVGTQDPVTPVWGYPAQTNDYLDYNGMVAAYIPGGAFQTGLTSILDVSTEYNDQSQNQPNQIDAFQISQYKEELALELRGPNNYFEPLAVNPGSMYYTLCDGDNICPTTPGVYTVNLISQSWGINYDQNSNGYGYPLPYNVSTAFKLEPQGVSEAICPNNDQNNGGPINTFNGTAPTTGTMPPQCGVQCPNNAFNPLPEGFAGVGTQYCNIFCPNGQDNYAGGPGNDAPCTQCPNGVITTGQCSQYCFNGWGLIISPDSACAGFGTPLNYTYIGNCGLVIPSNPNAYNNNGIHHDLAGSNLGSGSGGINTGFGDVPFGGSSGIGQLCYNLLINNTNSSILIGKNTISNNTTQSSGPFGGFLNHLSGTTSSTTIKST